jgi:hypothetical protein
MTSFDSRDFGLSVHVTFGDERFVFCTLSLLGIKTTVFEGSKVTTALEPDRCYETLDLGPIDWGKSVRCLESDGYRSWDVGRDQ